MRLFLNVINWKFSLIDSLFNLPVYHENRYNTSLKNPCFKSACSHLCLLVPGGRRCACPDNSVQPSHRSTAEVVCDAGEFIRINFKVRS